MYWSINFLTEVKNLHEMLIMIIIPELKESVETRIIWRTPVIL